MALFVIIATLRNCNAAIAQSVEHVIGNDEVIGPNPISSSINKDGVQSGSVFVYGISFPDRADDKLNRSCLKAVICFFQLVPSP